MSMHGKQMMRILLWLSCATLWAGCPRLDICVTVPNKSAQSFTIEVAEGDDCDRPAQVTRLIVRRISDGKVFWNIGSSEGVRISTVHYGEVPPGLAQGLSAEPLVPGERVNITVDGRGTSGGIDVTVSE